MVIYLTSEDCNPFVVVITIKYQANLQMRESGRKTHKKKCWLAAVIQKSDNFYDSNERKRNFIAGDLKSKWRYLAIDSYSAYVRLRQFQKYETKWFCANALTQHTHRHGAQLNWKHLRLHITHAAHYYHHRSLSTWNRTINETIETNKMKSKQINFCKTKQTWWNYSAACNRMRVACNSRLVFFFLSMQ